MDQQTLRSRILEIVNMIVTLEGGYLNVSDIRIVDAPVFFDNSYGTSMMEDDGTVAIRVTVRRPPDHVADTILHETAHVLMGPADIETPDHGPAFQALYMRLREKYLDIVMDELTRLG